MSRNQTRSTRQRKAIVKAIHALHNHPTADQVFFEVRKQLPTISLGTVYRNLNLLVEQGTVAELSTPENVRRYDAATDPHGHIICTECGKIADASPPNGPTGEIILSMEAVTGYRIEWHRLEFYGVCPECGRKNAG